MVNREICKQCPEYTYSCRETDYSMLWVWMCNLIWETQGRIEWEDDDGVVLPENCPMYLEQTLWGSCRNEAV